MAGYSPIGQTPGWAKLTEKEKQIRENHKKVEEEKKNKNSSSGGAARRKTNTPASSGKTGGKSSGTQTNKTGGGYSPISGPSLPLERIKERVSGNTPQPGDKNFVGPVQQKKTAGTKNVDIYSGGAARRRSNMFTSSSTNAGLSADDDEWRSRMSAYYTQCWGDKAIAGKTDAEIDKWIVELNKKKKETKDSNTIQAITWQKNAIRDAYSRRTQQAQEKYDNATRKEVANLTVEEILKLVDENTKKASDAVYGSNASSSLGRGYAQKNASLLRIVAERREAEKEKEKKVARRNDRMLQREAEQKYGLDPYTTTKAEIQEKIRQNKMKINAAKTREEAEELTRDNRILASMLKKDSIYSEMERNRETEKYTLLDEQPDFYKKQNVNTKERNDVYRIINNVDGYGDYLERYEEGGPTPEVYSGKTFSYVNVDNKKYLFLTFQEKRRYNYLYNTQGKKSAKEYLEFLEPDLDKRQTEDKMKKASEFAEEHPVAASAFSMLESPARGLSGFVSTVGDIGAVLSGKEINPYSKYKQLTYTSKAVLETVSNNINSEWGRFFYSAGMSIGDNVVEMGVMSLLTAGLGPALKGIDNAADLAKAVNVVNKIAKYGTTLMVSGDVAVNSVIEGKAKGYSDGKALTLALVSAWIEGATEKWSLDNIMDDFMKKPKTTMSAILRGVAAEGSEEGLSSAANMVVDSIVNGSDADIAKRIQELKENGYSDKGALAMALTESILPDMAAGALGGGLMGGMHYGTSKLFGGTGEQKTAGTKGKGVVVFGETMGSPKRGLRDLGRGGITERTEDSQKRNGGSEVYSDEGKNGDMFDDIVGMGKGQAGNAQNVTGAKNGAKSGILYSVNQNGSSKGKKYGPLLSSDNRARFASEVDGVFDGSFSERMALVLGDTPDLLQKYGAGNHPLTVNPSAVFKMAYPTGYLGLSHGHNLGIAAVKHLPEQISDPLAILKSNSVDGSLVLLTEWVDRNNNRVVVPVHLNKNGVLGIENRVTSAHGRDIKPLLTDKNGNSNVLYTKGNESIDSLIASSGLQLPGVEATASSGLQLPGAPSEDTLINHSISQSNGNYNHETQKNVSFGEAQGKNGDMFDDIVGMGKGQAGNAQNVTGAKNGAKSGILYSVSDANKSNGQMANKNGDMFDDIVGMGKEQGGNIKNGTETKNEGIYDYTKSFAEQVEDWIAGKVPRNDTLLVGATPDILKQLGFNALPVTIDQTHVDYAINGTKDTSHHLGKDMLKQLPEALENPVAVFRSSSEPNRIIVLLEMEHNGKSVVVPIEIDGYGFNNHVRLDSNFASSIYAKNNALTELMDAIESESKGKTALFYWDKKRSLSLLQRAGLHGPDVRFKTLFGITGGKTPTTPPRAGFVHSIRENGANVNMKLENETETQQFKRWFGDWQGQPSRSSRVVNRNGKPKPVYATKIPGADGYVFSDINKNAVPMSDFPGGDGQTRAYLNIRNPLNVSLSQAQAADGTILNQYVQNAKKNGNDGVVFRVISEKGDTMNTLYSVLTPNQVKAVDNVGTYNGKTDNVLYSAHNSDAGERGLEGLAGGRVPAGDEKQALSFEAFRKTVETLGFRVISEPRAERMIAGIDLENINGYKDDGRSEIYINPNAEDPQAVVMKHELTHILENVSSKYLEKASRYIKNRIPEVWKQTEERVKTKYANLGIDVSDRLDSEVMAEVASKLSTDEAINRFAKVDARFCRNVSLWFSYMAKQIKSVFSDLTTAEKLEVAAYKWEKALKKAETRNVSENSGVIYLSANDERGLSIKKQLSENLDRIMQLPVVKRLTFDTNPTEGIAQLKNNLLKRIQNSRDGKKISVNREGFGTIQIGYSEIKSGLKYLSTKEELASVDAIPDVIKNGIQIYEKSNHKGRDYPTFTFAAPIELNGKPYGMAVVVKRTSENKYKVHRLLMPGGAALEFPDNLDTGTKTKATKATFSEMTDVSDGERPPITFAANDSLTQKNDTVNSNSMQNSEKNADLKFLFAGNQAQTKDTAGLEQAKRLSVLGETPEQILRETGYFKGLDGKWRFELDDSKMKIKKEGGKVPDILQSNFVYGGVSGQGQWFTVINYDEPQDFNALNRLADKINKGEAVKRLSELIDYDQLFLAYPSLRNVLVKADFNAVAPGEALYSPKDNTIYISPQHDVNKNKEMLLHEISHAIQYIEDFASGASPLYWELMEGVSPEKAVELYENTAGEIEARDVESRADLTAEERRNTFPESAKPNDNVVFVEEDDVSFRLVGWRNDGIEVYETSDEVKTLPYRERKKQFLERMKNEFRGRTAKFERNGKTYYATFEEADVRKNIYGDKTSDQHGLDSKVNVGADGDIFELVEDADFIKNSSEKGKKIRAHQGVTNWDYFSKTVQIDGMVFDVLINVRKKNDGEFVYSIQLNENKNAKALPPSQHTLRQGGVKSWGALRSDNDSVSQSEQSVNNNFMQKSMNYAGDSGNGRTIEVVSSELMELDRLLDDESLTDEEFRKLDRKSRKLERELAILTARQTAGTAGLNDTAGLNGAANGVPKSPDWFIPKAEKTGDKLFDAVDEYHSTGNSDSLPTRQSAKQSQKYYTAKADQIAKELGDLNAALGGEMTELEREQAELYRNSLMTQWREAVSKNKVLSEVLDILDEIDTVARPNHKWVESISADLSDKRNVMKFGTYGMNDFERNLRHFFGKHFDMANEKILQPLYDSKKRYAKGVEHYSDLIYEKVVKDLGIKKGSRMSAAVQWLGEGEKPINKRKGADLAPYSFDDCAAEFGKEKAQRIRAAAEIFRTCYDELIEDINTTRKRLYPNNPEKLVKKRKDYFRHFQEESNNLRGLKATMQNHLGIDPTLVGISETTKPKTKWQSMAQERTGNKTQYDAVGGFLDYLPQAEYAIFIDPNIVNIRSFAYDLAAAKAKEGANGNPDANGFIRYLQKYANRLAGKTTSAFDRALADSTVGRPALAALSWFNNRTKANAVLGNFSSVVAQFQNITNVTGKIKRETDILAGAAKTLAGLFGDKKVRALYQDSGFLSERYLDKKLNRFEKKMSPSRWAAAVLGLTDEIGTRITWNAAYLEGKRLSPDNPVQYADNLTRSCVAGRGIGETPMMFESQLGKLFLPFRVEVMNTVNVWQDMLFDETHGGRDGKAGKVKNTAYNLLKFTEYAVACALVNVLVAGLKSDEFDPLEDVGEGLKKAEEEAGDDPYRRAGLSVLRPAQELYRDWADGYGSAVGADFLHDVVSGVSQANEEAKDDIYKKAGLSILRPMQNLAGDVASNYPLTSAALGIMGLDSDTTNFLFNGSVYNAGGAGMPAASSVSSALKKLGKGQGASSAAEVVKSFVLPWGGSQLDKAVRGAYEYFNGATTQNAYERMAADAKYALQDGYEEGSDEKRKKDRGTLKYLVEPTKENFVKSVLFGPSAFGGAQDEYYSDKTRRMSEDETEQILSKEGFGPRKVTFDEILAEHVYNAERDERKENAADRFFDGKDLGGEQGPELETEDENLGSSLYAMYKSGIDKTIPFRNIPLDLSVTIDSLKYEAHLTPDEARAMGEDLSGRLTERFSELDSAPQFAALSAKEKESFLNSFASLELTRIKAEHFRKIGDMTEEAFDAYDLSYRRSVAKKERELYTQDVEKFVAYQAVDVERQYLQYASKVTPETRRQAKKYAEYAATREPDEVDAELLRVSNLTGTNISVGGNPSGILTYSKKKQSYVIDMPDTEVYALMDTVERSCRSALAKKFSTSAYKNADIATKKEIIAAVKADVRKSVKETYKKKYKSVRVDALEQLRNIK